MSLDLTETGADSALATLCSATPGVFSEEIWARRAWLSRARDLPAQNLFSVADVDELLSRRGLRTPFLRMAKDGSVIATNRYTGSGGTGANIADQVRDEDVLRLFSQGATIVLQGLHRTWEPVRRLACGLAAELGHPVQVNAYITPAQNQGFAPHYDTHDVFVLQVSGRKQWTVHAPVVELPNRPWDTVAAQVAARATEEPLIATDLEPGDCLYLPRGFIHSAKALGGTTVHLTFGIHAVTQADVVRAVLDEILTQDWRASMPVGWNPLTADLSTVVTRMGEAIANLDQEAVAARLYDARAAATRPEPVSPVAQAEAAAQLAPEDIVRLRTGISARLTATHLHTAIGVSEVAHADHAALEVLLTGHSVSVQNLPCDTATIAGLLREGILVIETAR